MRRRDLLAGAGAGSLAAVASSLLAPRVALAAEGQPDSEAGRALAELQQALDELEAGFAAPEAKLRTALDFAEARRMLLHVLLHGLETWLEADPQRPFFRPFIHQHKKLLGDNPDARYFSAVIDDQRRYRIRGNLAGATYTSFTVELAPNPDGPGVGTTLNDTQFKADANGDYEIVLSRKKEEGNWMQLPEGASSVTTRHYYERKQSINNDRLHVIPIDIENLDSAPPRPSPTDAEIAAGIRRLTTFVRGNVVTINAENSPDWVSRVPNQFVPPVVDDSNKAVGYAAVDNVYAMAPFVLGPNQALVIRGRFPRCRFANLVLWNRFMQTLDYETRTISLNRAQVVQDAEGNFEIIIAHKDPGRPNWLDTEGRPYGLMFWRFQLPEEDIQALETEVITL
jgi:hypothetical protein